MEYYAKIFFYFCVCSLRMCSSGSCSILLLLSVLCIHWCGASPYSLTKCTVSDKPYIKSQGSEYFFKTLGDAVADCPCSPAMYHTTNTLNQPESTIAHYYTELTRVGKSNYIRPGYTTSYSCVINIDFKSTNSSLSNTHETITFQPRDNNGTLLNIYSTLSRNPARSIDATFINTDEPIHPGSRNAISISNLVFSGSGSTPLFSEMVDLDLIVDNCTIQHYSTIFSKVVSQISLYNLLYFNNCTISNGGLGVSLFDCSACSLVRVSNLFFATSANYSSTIVASKFPQDVGAISFENNLLTHNSTWTLSLVGSPDVLELIQPGITELLMIDGYSALDSLKPQCPQFKLWNFEISMHCLYIQSGIPQLSHIESSTADRFDCHASGCISQSYLVGLNDQEFCLITDNRDSEYISKTDCVLS